MVWLGGSRCWKVYSVCHLSRRPLALECIQRHLFFSVNIGFDDLQVCADPGVPENGFRTPSGGVFFESSVTRFHCQDGFKLKGSTKRLCIKYFNGTLGWIPSDKPICVQEGKVLKPIPLPLSWKPLMWSACPTMAPGVQSCVCFRGQYPGLQSLFQD